MKTRLRAVGIALLVLACGKQITETPAGTVLATLPASPDDTRPMTRASKLLDMIHDGISAGGAIRVSFEHATSPPGVRDITLVVERNRGWELSAECSPPVKVEDFVQALCLVRFQFRDMFCRKIDITAPITITSDGKAEGFRGDVWVLQPNGPS